MLLRECSDSFYKLPRIVACFIGRANNELPDRFAAFPWTKNRLVTLWDTVASKPVRYFPYDSIERDVVACLDAALKEAINV
jgi:hypothetical protein